jgi:hypothetical protein
MSALIGFGGPFGVIQPRPFAPTTSDTLADVIALLEDVGDPQTENHQQSADWLYAAMAQGLVKKIVVSVGEGLAGINIGNLEDWILLDTPQAVAAQIRAFGASTFMGMMDTTLTLQHVADPWPGAAGPLSRRRQPGDMRPAFYALQLTIQKIGTYTDVEQLSIGDDVWAYAFETPAGPVWVLWYDDGELYLPSQTPPSVELSLEIGSPAALVTRTPVTAGPAAAEKITTSNGTLTLELDSIPVFVEQGE